MVNQNYKGNKKVTPTTIWGIWTMSLRGIAPDDIVPLMLRSILMSPRPRTSCRIPMDISAPPHCWSDLPASQTRALTAATPSMRGEPVSKRCSWTSTVSADDAFCACVGAVGAKHNTHAHNFLTGSLIPPQIHTYLQECSDIKGPKLNLWPQEWLLKHFSAAWRLSFEWETN